MRYLMLLVLCLAMASPAMADFKGPGNAGKPGAPAKEQRIERIDRARDVMHAPEKAECQLTGNIIEKIGNDMYNFHDSSGTVAVRIDKGRFHGQEVRPNTRVRLSGRVEKSGGKRIVEVMNLRINP